MQDRIVQAAMSSKNVRKIRIQSLAQLRFQIVFAWMDSGDIVRRLILMGVKKSSVKSAMRVSRETYVRRAGCRTVQSTAPPQAIAPRTATSVCATRGTSRKIQTKTQ